MGRKLFLLQPRLSEVSALCVEHAVIARTLYNPVAVLWNSDCVAPGAKHTIEYQALIIMVFKPVKGGSETAVEKLV